jgi:hypothetical protein
MLCTYLFYLFPGIICFQYLVLHRFRAARSRGFNMLLQFLAPRCLSLCRSFCPSVQQEVLLFR